MRYVPTIGDLVLHHGTSIPCFIVAIRDGRATLQGGARALSFADLADLCPVVADRPGDLSAIAAGLARRGWLGAELFTREGNVVTYVNNQDTCNP